MSNEYFEALAKAKVSLENKKLPFVEAEIKEIHKLGFDERTKPKVAIQGIVVQVEDKERKYVFRGEQTIKSIFGDFDEKTMQFKNIVYEEDEEGNTFPAKVKVPNIHPNKEGVYWYGQKT